MKILIVKPQLLKKWIENNLINNETFSRLDIGTNTYFYIASKEEYILSPVKSGNALCSKDEAVGFVKALVATRNKINDIPISDSIYVEEYSVLLPTYTTCQVMDDKVVLGTWLSGGVVLSTDSFKRLTSLVAFLSQRDLKDVINTAGFNALNNGEYLSIQKLIPDEKHLEEDKNTHLCREIKHDKFELIGRPYLEDFFNEHIIDIILDEEKYNSMGIEFPSAVILHGAPGCGKTFAVEKLIKFLNWPSFAIETATVASPYIHDTSKKIAEVFEKAIENAPSVIVIDEMEAYFSDRAAGQASGLHHVEEVDEFLRWIPEAIKNKVLIIAMTNMIEMIDPAIMRRGRFDHIIEVTMPSKEEVASLVHFLYKNLPKDEDLNLTTVIDELTGKPLSDVTFVVRESARLAVKNVKDKIDNECLKLALDNLPRINAKSSKIRF